MRTDDGAPAHWGFWATSGLAVAILLVVYVVQAGAGAYRMSISVSIAAAVAGCAAVVAAVKLKRGSDLREYLALTTVPRATMLKWIGILAAFVIIVEMVTRLLGRPIVPDYVRDIYARADSIWLLGVFAVAAAPLFEELFFRGFVLTGFAASALGARSAVVLTAAAFAAMHVQYDAYDVGQVFVMGLLLGAARTATGSLFVPLTLHALANLIGLAEAALLS